MEIAANQFVLMEHGEIQLQILVIRVIYLAYNVSMRLIQNVVNVPLDISY